MKRIKNEQTTNPYAESLPCDDCNEAIEMGAKMVRIGVPDDNSEAMFWYFVLHPKCAKDLGGDLAIEVAR